MSQKYGYKSIDSIITLQMTLFFDCLFPYTDPYAVIVTTLPNYKKGSSVVLQPTDVKNAPVNPNCKY